MGQAKTDGIASLLRTYSLEITARDRAARRAVIRGMPPGSDVFVADLPDQPPDIVVEACAELRRGGLEPVPHLVARNIAGRRELQDTLARLRGEARVAGALLVGGDRTDCAGPFATALDLLQSGCLQESGITRVAFACYPEGHPRIPRATLRSALARKVAEAEEAGFEVLLISQFAFQAEPVIAYTRELRAAGLHTPLRSGVAGPAARRVLLDFGRELGAGPSLGQLEARCKDGHDQEEETPGTFLQELVLAQAREPDLNLAGAHFYPFGSTDRCVTWAEAQGDAGAGGPAHQGSGASGPPTSDGASPTP